MKSSLRSTGKMPRYELELLLREATRETRETREREDDGAPPSSVVLPLVTRKPRTDARD